MSTVMPNQNYLSRASAAWDDKMYQISIFFYRTCLENEPVFSCLSLEDRNKIKTRLEKYSNACAHQESAKEWFYYYNDTRKALEQAKNALDLIQTDEMEKIRKNVENQNNVSSDLKNELKRGDWNNAKDISDKILTEFPDNEFAGNCKFVMQFASDIEEKNKAMRAYEYNEKNLDTGLEFCEVDTKIENGRKKIKDTGYLKEESVKEYVDGLISKNSRLKEHIQARIEKDKMKNMFDNVRKCEFDKARKEIGDLRGKLKWKSLKTDELLEFVVPCEDIEGLTDETTFDKVDPNPMAYIDAVEKRMTEIKKEIDISFNSKDWARANNKVDSASKFFCEEFESKKQEAKKNQADHKELSDEVSAIGKDKLKNKRRKILQLHKRINNPSTREFFSTTEIDRVRKDLEKNMQRVIRTSIVAIVFSAVVAGVTAAYLWPI